MGVPAAKERLTHKQDFCHHHHAVLTLPGQTSRDFTSRELNLQRGNGSWKSSVGLSSASLCWLEESGSSRADFSAFIYY